MSHEMKAFSPWNMLLAKAWVVIIDRILLLPTYFIQHMNLKLLML